MPIVSEGPPGAVEMQMQKPSVGWLDLLNADAHRCRKLLTRNKATVNNRGCALNGTSRAYPSNFRLKYHLGQMGTWEFSSGFFAGSNASK
jgi:hypothetical protein